MCCYLGEGGQVRRTSLKIVVTHRQIMQVSGRVHIHSIAPTNHNKVRKEYKTCHTPNYEAIVVVFNTIYADSLFTIYFTLLYTLFSIQLLKLVDDFL